MLRVSILHRSMNSVPRCEHCGVTDLFVPDCNGPPEAIERPALVGKVGEKCEREANRQLPFDWCQPGLLCNFVDRSARIRNSDMPNRILARYAERNDS